MKHSRQSTLTVRLVRVAAAAIIAAACAVSCSTFEHDTLSNEKSDVVKSQAAPAPDVELAFVGSETCKECHTYQHSTYSETLHGRIFLMSPRSEKEKLGCEACHGAGSNHAETKKSDQGIRGGLVGFRAGGPRSVDDRNAVCLGCHESGMRTHWRGSEHAARDLACTTCHQVMRKKSPKFLLAKATVSELCVDCHKQRRAQMFSHARMPMREGKLICTDCHNPHGTTGEKLLKAGTTNDTCYQCHADKRGPFLWEHAPVREDCANCHNPHGTPHRSLLKVAAPRLCQQCHSQTLANHPSAPGNIATAFNQQFVVNRGCLNCHGAIHGSNHIRGADLHR